MKIIRTTAIVFWLLPLAAAGFSCAPRGDVERPAPVESGGDEDALVRGDAPRSIGAQGALDRMNQDKKTADDLLANGRYQEAADLVAPWVARKAADPQVYAMLARAQWKLGRHGDAVKNYEESLRLDYSSAYTHLELAEMLLETGKSGRALTEFELAVQFGKDDPLPHYNYGLALYGMGRVDDALAHWENAYTNNPKDPRYAEAMGIGLSERDPAKALVYFEAALTHGADHPGFHNNFGLLLERIGDYARAESEFKKAIAGEPGDRGYRQNLALSYMKSKQPELAVPLWQALHGEDPAGPTCRIYLGRAYLETGRYRDAADLLEKWVETAGAVEDEPGLDEAYSVLAMSFRGLKQTARAAASMRKAVELNPGSVGHRINYGVILAEDGRIAEARAQWVEALRLDPENATAKGNLSAYER